MTTPTIGSQGTNLSGNLSTPGSVNQEALRRTEEQTKRREEESVRKSESLEEKEEEDPISLSSDKEEYQGSDTPSDPIDELKLLHSILTGLPPARCPEDLLPVPSARRSARNQQGIQGKGIGDSSK